MNYTRPQTLLLLIWTYFCSGTSSRPSEVDLQSQYLRTISAYRRLERSLPPKELRALTGIGLLNGARQAEQKMEYHLIQAIKELLLDTDHMLPKIVEIEQQMVRNKHALNILSMAMDVLSGAKDEQKYRQELRNVLHENQMQHYGHLQPLQQPTKELDLGKRLGQLRQQILQQVPQMKSHLDVKIEKALESLLKQATAGGPLAKASIKVLHVRAANRESTENMQERKLETMHMIKTNQLNAQDDSQDNLTAQQFERNVKNNDQPPRKGEIEELDRDIDPQNVTDNNIIKTNENQEDGDGSSEIGGNGNDDFDAGGGGGGGIVGIIGGLSGGEGGSDVGALIGALTGLISTLFGPGGLDIESLIGTATALISGLLSGNKNFGTVLGQYVGTALDGLSGGGGAINNGVFLGNFVGTVLAALSSDPEDEGPPQPLTFTKNFLSSFIESKLRTRSGEVSEERHGSAELPHQKKEGASGGLDSGGFVKQIASHLVSSALGLLLNASLGGSGGASQASTGLFSSSSHRMKSTSRRSWTQLSRSGREIT